MATAICRNDFGDVLFANSFLQSPMDLQSVSCLENMS